MAIQLSLRSGTLTAMLEGEIDHHTARELREEIDSAASRTKPKRLILDFSKIRFMDSSGVGLILGRYRLVSQWGGELCVANLSPNLERIVSLAGLKEICTVYRREENEQESKKHNMHNSINFSNRNIRWSMLRLLQKTNIKNI